MSALACVALIAWAAFLWRRPPPTLPPEALFGPRPDNWVQSGGGFVRLDSEVFAFAAEWPKDGVVRLTVTNCRPLPLRRESESRHLSWQGVEAKVQELIEDWGPE